MLLIQHNKAFFHKLVFGAILLNGQMNVFNIVRLVVNYRDLNALLILGTTSFIVLHLTVFGMLLWNVSNYVIAVHMPKLFLIKIISLNNCMMNYKLKYLSLYERLNSKKKYGITIDSATITHKYCLSVSIPYSETYKYQRERFGSDIFLLIKFHLLFLDALSLFGRYYGRNISLR